jgi:hypothetical protein
VELVEVAFICGLFFSLDSAETFDEFSTTAKMANGISEKTLQRRRTSR